MILLDEVNLCLPKGADPAPPRGNEKHIKYLLGLEYTVKARAATQDHAPKICAHLTRIMFSCGNL